MTPENGIYEKGRQCQDPSEVVLSWSEQLGQRAPKGQSLLSYLPWILPSWINPYRSRREKKINSFRKASHIAENDVLKQQGRR